MVKREMYLQVIAITFSCLILLFSGTSAKADAIIADHYSVAEFYSIPDSVIQQVRTGYRIFYGHTSHGSQILTGLTLLYSEDTLYARPRFHEHPDDLGHNGDTSWVPPTRDWLNTHPDYNLVMWSWCGGCSDNTEEGINIYLNKLNELEQDYPGVIFIYMTGHLDGTGPEGNLYTRNNQIRNYCISNDKILFDFADIESYDPDGNYYPDESDGCDWCDNWCSSHPCPSCDCAHSHCFNCYLKGKAFWWMMARISGWNLDQDSIPNITSTSPEQNQLNVSVSTDISVTFDIDMDETTINDSTFLVNARSTGLHLGSIIYDSPTRIATFEPMEDFEIGEVITVVFTTGVQSSGGIPLPSAYVWSFTSDVYDGSGAFAVDSVYPAGDGSISVFSADVDGDGDMDVATANRNSNNVSVLMNNGDGTFTSHSIYAVGDYPHSVFSADLDGDGDQDLATANSGSINVSVLLNNGDGSFAPQSVYAVGEDPRSVFSADLDGDGNLDLAAANSISDNVSILLNNGDGSFAPQSVYAAGDGPRSVFSADLDGDGDLDLVVTDYDSDSVSVLLNDGDGSFALYSVYPVGDRPWSVLSADLDGDEDLDLAAANSYSDNVSVLLNNGDGSFVPDSVYPVGNYPVSVFSADLDGDEDLDLAVSNLSSNDVSVLLNHGDGTFASHSVYPEGDYPNSVFAVDLDGDGDLDLATANFNSNNISVLLNLSRGDINGDRQIAVSDVIFLINYLFKGGPAPVPEQVADTNCSGEVNVSDVVHLINYLFKGGPPPGC